MLLQNRGLIQREIPILFFANKMDINEAMEAADVANELELENITDRPWTIQACSALRGDGIDEGMNWLTT